MKEIKSFPVLLRIIKKKKIVDENFRPDMFSKLFSSFLFTGYIPIASGTFGSIFALLFFFIKGFDNPLILTTLIAIFFTLGVVTSRSMMKRYGDDPSVVVIDEVVGMWITILVFILLSGMNLSLFYYLICFLLFRFFDIVKLQPAKYFDNSGTPFGIMMDDAIAGLYAGVASYIISLSKYNPF